MSKLSPMKYRWLVFVPRDHEAAEGLTHGIGIHVSVLALFDHPMKEWEAQGTAKLLYGKTAFALKMRTPDRGYARDITWAKELFWSRKLIKGVQNWCLVCEKKSFDFKVDNHRPTCPFNRD